VRVQPVLRQHARPARLGAEPVLRDVEVQVHQRAGHELDRMPGGRRLLAGPALGRELGSEIKLRDHSHGAEARHSSRRECDGKPVMAEARAEEAEHAADEQNSARMILKEIKVLLADSAERRMGRTVGRPRDRSARSCGSTRGRTSPAEPGRGRCCRFSWRSSRSAARSTAKEYVWGGDAV
jgi:hypothetical protein